MIKERRVYRCHSKRKKSAQAKPVTERYHLLTIYLLWIKSRTRKGKALFLPYIPAITRQKKRLPLKGKRFLFFYRKEREYLLFCVHICLCRNFLLRLISFTPFQLQSRGIGSLANVTNANRMPTCFQINR